MVTAMRATTGDGNSVPARSNGIHSAIAFVTRLIDDAAMEDLGVATKLDPNGVFLCRLGESGRRQATVWPERNFETIGTASSVDLKTADL